MPGRSTPGIRPGQALIAWHQARGARGGLQMSTLQSYSYEAKNRSTLATSAYVKHAQESKPHALPPRLPRVPEPGTHNLLLRHAKESETRNACGCACSTIVTRSRPSLDREFYVGYVRCDDTSRAKQSCVSRIRPPFRWCAGGRCTSFPFRCPARGSPPSWTSSRKSRPK